MNENSKTTDKTRPVNRDMVQLVAEDDVQRRTDAKRSAKKDLEAARDAYKRARANLLIDSAALQRLSAKVTDHATGQPFRLGDFDAVLELIAQKDDFYGTEAIDAVVEADLEQLICAAVRWSRNKTATFQKIEGSTALRVQAPGRH